MKKAGSSQQVKVNGGRRIVASMREAVRWAQVEDVPVLVSEIEVPVVNVREVRKGLG